MRALPIVLLLAASGWTAASAADSPIVSGASSGPWESLREPPRESPREPPHDTPHDTKDELDATLVYFRAQPGYNAVGGVGVGYRGIGYGRLLNSWFELSIRGRFIASANTDQSPGQTIFEATVGPTFNFALGQRHGLGDEFFVSLGGGVNYTEINGISVPNTYYSTGYLYSTNPVVALEVGKRFALFSNVSLKPSFMVSWMIGDDLVSGTANATPAYSFNPVEIAVVF